MPSTLSEQALGRVVDAVILGERPGLGLDLLGGEHPADGREQRIAVRQFQLPGRLLDAEPERAPSRL
jgi:hypothetical protein